MDATRLKHFIETFREDSICLPSPQARRRLGIVPATATAACIDDGVPCGSLSMSQNLLTWVANVCSPPAFVLRRGSRSVPHARSADFASLGRAVDGFVWQRQTVIARRARPPRYALAPSEAPATGTRMSGPPSRPAAVCPDVTAHIAPR